MNRSVDLCFEFRLGHDVDVPSAKLTGQTNILASFADGQRKLIIANQHDRFTDHLAQNHFVDFGRLQCVGDHDHRVFVKADDINSLARQFVDDDFNAIAADANTGSYAIDF